MKTYTVKTAIEFFYYDVEAESEYDASQIAEQRARGELDCLPIRDFDFTSSVEENKFAESNIPKEN